MSAPAPLEASARTMRIVPSSLADQKIVAYTVEELPREGRARVFRYAYVEAERLTERSAT